MNNALKFLQSRSGLVACLLVAGLGGYLLLIHTGHVVAALPYLLLLACPLMHFFGHGHGHQHHGESGQPNFQNLSGKGGHFSGRKSRPLARARRDETGMGQDR